MPDLLRRSENEPDAASPRSSTGAADASLSVLGAAATVDGDLEARGEVRIEGVVRGTVRSQGPVVVAPDGAVEGRIEADLAVVGGRVDGEIHASGMVRIEATARVTADVHTPTLAIEDGARFHGDVSMEHGASDAGRASAA